MLYIGVLESTGRNSVLGLNGNNNAPPQFIPAPLVYYSPGYVAKSVSSADMREEVFGLVPTGGGFPWMSLPKERVPSGWSMRVSSLG